MKIVVAGGSGFLGRMLCPRLTALGHEVVVLTRDASGQPPGNGVRLTQWDPDGDVGIWAIEVESADAVINLSGADLAARRWTTARKAELRESRVLPTRSLVAAIRRATARPPVFIQGSGAGFYGSWPDDREFDESFPPGDDFLSDLCVAWEAEAHPVTSLGSRLVILRSGVVLASSGGIIGQMRLPFQLFVGGPVASGRQYLSWIHCEDWIRIVIWALTTPAVNGVVNATAPEPVTSTTFSAALARALRRPSWLRAPGFALRLLFGEIADVALINGQRVLPKRALEAGFRFDHPTIEDAMMDALSRKA